MKKLSALLLCLVAHGALADATNVTNIAFATFVRSNDYFLAMTGRQAGAGAERGRDVMLNDMFNAAGLWPTVTNWTVIKNLEAKTNFSASLRVKDGLLVGTNNGLTGYGPQIFFPTFHGSNGWDTQQYTNGAQYSLGAAVADYDHVQDVGFFLGWNNGGVNPLEPIFGFVMESAYSNAPGPIQGEMYWTLTGTNRASGSRPFGLTFNRANGLVYQMGFNADQWTVYDSTGTTGRWQITPGNSWYFYNPQLGSNAINATAGDGHQVAAQIQQPLYLRKDPVDGQPPTLVWTNLIQSTGGADPALNIMANPYYGDVLRFESLAAPANFSLTFEAAQTSTGVSWRLRQTNDVSGYSNVMDFDRGVVGFAPGVVYPTNALAPISDRLNNGDFWIGTLSNALQAAWKSNDVVNFKKLAP